MSGYGRVRSCGAILLTTGLKEPGPSILCLKKLEIGKKHFGLVSK
jgi:hypothetical protein